MYVTLLCCAFHAVYRQRSCRVQHCHSRNASLSICQSSRSPSPVYSPLALEAVCCGQHCDLLTPALGNYASRGPSRWRYRRRRAVPSLRLESSNYAMPIDVAKKGREMRPQYVALTGAGVQTRHHPNSKSRSATSSFRGGFPPPPACELCFPPRNRCWGLNLRFLCAQRTEYMLFGAVPKLVRSERLRHPYACDFWALGRAEQV